MQKYRHSVICTILLVLVCAACSSSPNTSQKPASTLPATANPVTATSTKVATPVATATPASIVTRYTSRVRLSGNYSPDDMAFDKQGNILFSDVKHGTINRLNSNNTVTQLVSGLAEPEGIIPLGDGSMIVSEQGTNRILSFSPGGHTPAVLRVLPGTNSTANCKAGIDSIALDPTTQTIIVPDSPTGNVYRLSLDGHKMTLLTSGLVRPVGAAVDAKGNVYLADECGGAVYKITPSGQKTRLGGFGMPDDVAFDLQGNLLVVDLLGSAHDLIRVNQATGKHDILASKGLIEPQGLLVDKNGHIFVSDDSANLIMEYIPA